MLKTAIRFFNNKIDAQFIFNATPDISKLDSYHLYDHQWFLTDDMEQVGYPIEDENFEMYATSTTLIKKKGYEGLYLYCYRIDKKTRKVTVTEHVRLYSDINKMIESGTVFNCIETFDEYGRVRFLS